MDIQAYIESGVIESYVMGMADEAEAAELQRLSHEYPAIKEALDACESWLLNTANANAVPPSDSVKEQLFSKLNNDQEEQSIKQANVLPITNRNVKTPLFKYFSAAAFLLFILSAALNFILYTKYQKLSKDYADLNNAQQNIEVANKIYRTKLDVMGRDIEMMSSPFVLKVPMKGVKGKEESLATVYWNTHTKDVFIISNNLPAPPTGMQYQLWALVDGKPLDAGVLQNCGIALCQLKQVQNAQAFAITLEKEGGSVSPSLDQLFVMGSLKS